MESSSRIEGNPGGVPAKGEVEIDFGWNLESQERTFDRISEWIRAVDVKSSSVLAIDTALIAVIVGLAARPGGWTSWDGILILLGGAFLIASVVMVALSIIPQLTGNKQSLIFFGDIARLSLTEYSVRVGSRSLSDYLADLNTQCHRNSEIALRKYSWNQRATRLLITGIIPWLISLFLILQR